MRDPNQGNQCKGFGFVTFAEKSSGDQAILMLNGQQLGRKPLQIRWKTDNTAQKQHHGATLGPHDAFQGAPQGGFQGGRGGRGGGRGGRGGGRGGGQDGYSWGVSDGRQHAAEAGQGEEQEEERYDYFLLIAIFMRFLFGRCKLVSILRSMMNANEDQHWFLALP